MIKISENTPIAPLTTMKVGGPARFFTIVSSENELSEAVCFANEKGISFFVLGGGSNTVFSDMGYTGLLIKTAFNNIEEQSSGGLFVGASVPFGKIVTLCASKGLGGAEWAGGIPGTIGGAVRGNAGAFGGETKDIVESVTFFDIETQQIKKLSQEECTFGYRDSIFKHNSNIIIAVNLQLQPSQDPEVLKEKVKKNVQYRVERHPITQPSAGSIFKNVPVDRVSEKYIGIFKDAIKNDPFPIVPAAKIIAEAGLAGMKVGGAELSAKHTNYIVNTGNATASNVVDLISKIKDHVKQKFDIDLEPEPQIVS